MGRKLTKDKITEHKEQALNTMDNYITTQIEDGNSSKADKLSFWLEDWANFLSFEDSFKPRSLKRYKRGEIIKAHLGFNVGSEYGGLHFCVVLDKNNSVNSPVVTVVPLTSLKDDVDTENMRPGNVYLGDEIYKKLLKKSLKTKDEISASAEILAHGGEKIKIMDGFPELPPDCPTTITESFEHYKESQELSAQISKILSGMKKGSIALIGQIRTISKIRIYEPKTSKDPLSNIRLSNENLDKIDNAIKELYTNF